MFYVKHITVINLYTSLASHLYIFISVSLSHTLMTPLQVSEHIHTLSISTPRHLNLEPECSHGTKHSNSGLLGYDTVQSGNHLSYYMAS
jgi:hypothetical protein